MQNIRLNILSLDRFSQPFDFCRQRIEMRIRFQCELICLHRGRFVTERFITEPKSGKRSKVAFL